MSEPTRYKSISPLQRDVFANSHVWASFLEEMLEDAMTFIFSQEQKCKFIVTIFGTRDWHTCDGPRNNHVRIVLRTLETFQNVASHLCVF
jgi:hypothetical protein